MVDWKKLSKQALDIGKDMTEKGVDSFKDWKDDPERIKRVEDKRMMKKHEKQMITQNLAERNSRKTGKKQAVISVISDSRGKVKIKDSSRIIIQEYNGEVYFSGGSDNKINYYLNSFEWNSIQQSKKTTSLGGALIGGAIAGSVGAIIGGTGKKGSVDASTAILTLENIDDGHMHKLVINCPQDIANQLMSFTTKDFI